ncbi:MAG: ATP-binding protein [Verrucomicrobiae bacterium]|nr:ATP-binding protein [Verrucomicrobiae bacterium]
MGGKLLVWGWFLSALPLLALNPGHQLKDYEHRHWGIAHGLPHATVRAVQQTTDGYLWTATEYGAARFNGERFSAFNAFNVPLLNRPFLNALTQAPDGALWIGSEGGGLIVYHQGAFQRLSTNDGLAGMAVRGFAPASPGNMWIVCDRGINFWATGELARVDIRGLSTNALCFSILQDQEGNLWVGTDRGLWGPMDASLPRAISVPNLSARTVYALAQSPEGSLWAGTDAGLYHISVDRRRATADLISALGPARVRAVYADRHGMVWVGTTTGLRRLRQGRLILEEEIPALRNISVFSFFEDREANLWIGAGNGLHCLQERTFITYSAQNGLEDEEVLTIARAGPERYLLGTTRGEVYVWENGQIRPEPRYQRQTMITAIHPDRQGRVWIGSRRGGLLCDDRGRSQTFDVAQGLPSGNIFAITEDQQGTLWVGTEKGLSRREGREFMTVILPVPEGQPQPVIRSLYLAHDNSLWVGTQEGLYHLKSDATNYYGQLQGFPAGLVYYITEDKKDRLWLGTAQGAVCHWEGQWRLYKPHSGFPTCHIYWLAHDEQGFTWFSTPWTIFRVETAQIFAYWRGERPLPTPMKFTQSDGLLAMECLGGRQSGGCQLPDGRLVFLTRRGLAVADPKVSASAFHPPRVVIERIRVNGREHPVSAHMELPAGSRVIEIEYAGLSFRQPEKVRHRYQLKGVDPDWVEAYQRRSATYANLAPGQYEFRVTADDGHGAWSVAGAGVELIIQPFFYQTAWFYLLLAGLALTGIYGGYRWRVRLLQRRNALLSARLAERTRELEQVMAERFRLEQAALARKQQETIGQMAAGIAHHLNNQLQAIQSSAALLEDAHKTPDESHTHLSYIEEAVGKMARIVEQLLAYGQRHWLRLKSVDLREFLPPILAKYPPGRVAVEWEQNLPLVKVDGGILEQALLVVLDNALQASLPHGPVKIRVQKVEQVPKDSAAPSAHQPRPFVAIQILDEGPGLSPQAQAHLFEPFFTTKEVGQGTGMGLAAAYGGLKQIGGWIELTNRPEGGCSATLFLPVAT